MYLALSVNNERGQFKSVPWETGSSEFLNEVIYDVSVDLEISAMLV